MDRCANPRHLRGELSYDVYDHSIAGVGSCFGGSGLAYYVHVDTDVSELIPSGEPPSGATPSFWVVTGRSQSSADAAFERFVPATDPDLDLVVTLEDAALVDAPSLCIDVAWSTLAASAPAAIAVERATAKRRGRRRRRRLRLRDRGHSRR